MNLGKEENGVASGRLIIESIVEAMVAGLEELYTKTIPPELFQVYLHASDYERLEGVFRELQAEAATALDQRVERLNRAMGKGTSRALWRLRHWIAELPMGRVLRQGRTEAQRIAKPQNGWQISFNRNEDPEASPGDIVIDATLMLAPRVELGAGMTTKSVRTIFRPDPTSPRASRGRRPEATAETLLQNPARPPAAVGLTRTAHAPRAVLRYSDLEGARRYVMTKSSIVIGRGGTGVWTDIKLATGTDVSREHLRIREDGGRFFLKDVSSLGTSIDGISVPGSMVRSGNQLIDQDIWVPLPSPSRISLAGVIEIEFSLVRETE